MCISGVSSMYNVAMHYLNSFLSCSIKYLIVAFLSHLFAIKIDVFSPFLQVLIPTVVFSMKAITENPLHDFLINSRYSCKKYCSHNSTLLGITITVDPWIKFGPAQEGRLFRQKVVIFSSFSSVIMTFFSPIGLISLIDSLHQ